MRTQVDFVRQSLELHLLYLRLFKEHMIFFAAALSPKEQLLIQQAETLKCELNNLLFEAVCLAQGIISPQVQASQELITPRTINAEQKTQYYTGIQIDLELSRLEQALCSTDSPMISPEMIEQVKSLNQRALFIGSSVGAYKRHLFQSVDSCQVFINLYPSLIRHTAEETDFYLEKVTRLQNGEELYPLSDAARIGAFWNHIMEEHAEFMRGFFDPREEMLIRTADRFAREFAELTRQAEQALQQMNLVRALNIRSLEAVNRLREFKKQGTEGLLSCQVKAIATPLLADHVFREASFYLRLLNRFVAMMP